MRYAIPNRYFKSTLQFSVRHSFQYPWTIYGGAFVKGIFFLMYISNCLLLVHIFKKLLLLVCMYSYVILGYCVHKFTHNIHKHIFSQHLSFYQTLLLKVFQVISLQAACIQCFHIQIMTILPSSCHSLYLLLGHLPVNQLVLLKHSENNDTRRRFLSFLSYIFQYFTTKYYSG